MTLMKKVSEASWTTLRLMYSCLKLKRRSCNLFNMPLQVSTLSKMLVITKTIPDTLLLRYVLYARMYRTGINFFFSLQSAVALITVIQSLCRTMHNMPFHTEEYVRLIEVVLLKFYEKCYQKFHCKKT